MLQNTILNEALKLQEIGWSIIPVGQDKKPLISWLEFQERRASKEEIKAWFRKFPKANIGVVTGPVSNLLVFDIDAKHGRTSGEFQFPVTVCSNTGGGGEHIFLRYPNFEVHNSAGVLFGEGIDIRGKGGYIVLPPSFHLSGKYYEWKEFCSPFDLELADIPEWLETALLNQSKKESPKLYEKDSSEIVEGTRNDTAVSVAGKIMSETPNELRNSIGYKKFKEWNSSITSPLLEDELKAVWKSVCKYNNKDVSKILKEKEGKKDSEKIYKTSFTVGNFLYEMVYDKELDKTFFIRCDSENNIECLDKIVSGERVYFPLPPTHMFVDKAVVLFPSKTIDYVNEKELLNEVRTFIHKYVDISEEFEQIASYYVLLTWLYDKFYELPYLRARGDYGSGKSRFLKTVGSISYTPIFTAGATTASPIFRIIDEVKGTLILDEADFAKSDMTSDIVKILNTGYQKGISVLRCEGNGTFEVKAYTVFGPKIIATRESFADSALESRFLVEEMGKSTLRADIPRETRKEFDEEARNLRNKLLKWRFDNYFLEIKANTEVIKGIHPRLNQIVLPLLSIIKDEEAKESLKEFIIKYNDDLIADRGLTKESDIIFAILKLEHDGFNEKQFTVKQISDEVNKLIDEESDQIKPRKMGWYLRKKLQLKTGKTRAGFTLNLNQNRDRINFLKDRYGVTDEEVRGEQVNNVNVDSIANGIAENNKNILQ